ncbi:HNH endonuclease [Mycolicibacterium fortuitum]|uniref:HNH endonuclease n=1 Tax=Mycolicibacterium fortuitum TaxID=1766 RepID=UPI003AACBBE4
MTWYSSDRRNGLPKNWPALRKRILERDNHLCQIQGPRCLVAASDVDHIQRGNDHAEDNLQSACSPCHLDKTSAESVARRKQLREARYRRPDRHPGALR